jgi:hypothetical protein
MNGNRERGWLKFLSGSLDVLSLTLGTAVMEGEEDPVKIIRIKCTPSMTSEVYDVSLSFKPNDSVIVYLPDKSKCDCPNGWLFCSHSLALFILIRLMQIKRDWTFDDLCKFMPPPIKSLQNLPLAAAHVLKSKKAAAKAVGKALAKEVPGYSAESDDALESEEADEMATLQRDLEVKTRNNVKSLDLCKLLENHLQKSKEAAEIDDSSVQDRDGGMANSSSRVTSDDIHEFNRIVVHSPLKPKRQYAKLVRHNCLQGMMDDGLIDDDNALITHIRFFFDTRNQELQQKHQTTRLEISRDGDLCGRYDKEFLRDYFDDDDDDDN